MDGMRGITEGRLRQLRRREDQWSMRRMSVEEQHGMDSEPERRALERATDYAVEAEMVQSELERQP